MFGDIIKVFIL